MTPESLELIELLVSLNIDLPVSHEGFPDILLSGTSKHPIRTP